MSFFETIGRKAIFTLDAETAHGVSIKALKSGIVPSCAKQHHTKLAQNIAGIDFPNPLGLAAGYDKNAEVPDAILKLGFGFTEIGTVTPKPQSGNPKPRIFRLIEDEGVINRLGFNNQGHARALERLERRKANDGIVGVNIGANKDSEDFSADYETGIRNFAHLASYFTVNISSPNTPGLRDLQTEDSLKLLLNKVFKELEGAKSSHAVPVFLKVAPDLSSEEINKIAKVVSASQLSGLMVSNTTLSRHGLKNKTNKDEMGGLSGRPIFNRSTIILARFRQLLSTKIPIIGIGGIDSTDAALQKMEAGADLLQLYSSMIYKGPGLASQIVNGLSEKVDSEKLENIGEIVGRKTDAWANKKLPEEV